MTVANSIKKALFAARGIAGGLGFRPCSVAIQTRAWSGAEPGQGTETITTTAITEGDGQPPKVRFLSQEELALGGHSSETVEVGPITPDFPGGGTALSVLKPSPANGQTLVVFRLTGPDHPNGANYSLRETRTDKSLRYMLVLERIADN